MDDITADLDSINVSAVLSSEPVGETQRSGRWVVQEPTPQETLGHVDPVLRSMPRTEADR